MTAPSKRPAPDTGVDRPGKATSPFRIPHAVVMMLLIIIATAALTYLIPSGAFERNDAGLVIPGTFRLIAKDYAPADILAARRSTTELAYPASPLAVFTSIPVGMQAMVLIQMVIDVFIPSTSGQAAVTMPILGPISQLAGVSGQVCVQAFIFGNGLTNTITPTSGMLLAYLATGNISYGQWVKFVLPLFVILAALSLVGVSVAVMIGYR